MGATPALPHPTFELEVSLRRGSFGRYAAELRFQDPESDAETRFEGIFPPLDLRALEELRFDPFRYGKALGRWLF